MTLAEFCTLVDAPSKWVLNARALLRDAEPYSLAAAERLAIIRLLNAGFGVPLARAQDVAQQAREAGGVARIATPDGIVAIEVDVDRICLAVATRAAAVSNTYARRRPGRRPKRSTRPIRAAEAYGIDIGLLKSNLERSPAARLRQLDAMAAFRSRVRRRANR